MVEKEGGPFSRFSRSIVNAVSRIRQTEFAYTQYSKRRSGLETELVIGLDFGTSSSKLVIQDVDRRNAYAVPFPGLAPSGHEYLLPTRVYLTSSGEFSLNKRGHALNLLKSKLFAGTSHRSENNLPNIEPEVAAIGYLALVLREARKYFMRSIAGDVSPGTIIWSVNAGLPEKFRQQAMTRQLEICVLAAWECSTRHESITLDLIRHWLQKASNAKSDKVDVSYIEDREKDLHPEEILAIPEVVAQVQGYARSDFRRTGLHMMVDVGATTLDASTFTLFDRDHEDRYTMWEAIVAPLGAHSLHLHLLRGLSKSLGVEARNQARILDPVSPTPNLVDIAPGITEEAIASLRSEFGNKAGVLLAKMVGDTHRLKDPHTREWTEGLRVFMCGGGRGIPLYRQRLESLPGANGSSGPFSWLAPFQFMEIPKPDNLHAPKLLPSDYHRLAVAYGLSFRCDDIGKYQEGTEIDEDEQMTQRHWRDAYVGAEVT